MPIEATLEETRLIVENWRKNTVRVVFSLDSASSHIFAECFIEDFSENRLKLSDRREPDEFSCDLEVQAADASYLEYADLEEKDAEQWGVPKDHPLIRLVWTDPPQIVMLIPIELLKD